MEKYGSGNIPTPDELRLLERLLSGETLREAAKAAGLSLSSASRLLSQARVRAGDPLFKRSGNRLLPTPRMRALSERLLPLLEGLSGFYEEERFDPGSLSGSFRILVTDNGFLGYVAPVIPELKKKAPGLTLDIIPLRRSGSWMIESGRADLGICAFPDNRKSLRWIVLSEFSYCLVLRKDHPVYRKWLREGELSLSDLSPYVQFMNRRFASGGQDEACGYERGPGTNRIYSPYFAAAPFAIIESCPDAVQWATMRAGRRAGTLSDALGVIPAEDFTDYGKASSRTKLVWAVRDDSNPANQWVRSLIVAAAKRNFGSGGTSDPGPAGKEF